MSNYVRITCRRCGGKGIFNFHRAHLGVPGLCFRCNGKGTELLRRSSKSGVAVTVLPDGTLSAPAGTPEGTPVSEIINPRY